MRWPRWSEAENEAIRRHYRPGAVERLARRLGRTVAALQTHASKLGVSAWKTRDAAFRAEVLDLRAKDLSTAAIARRVGAAPGTVYKVLRAAGLRPFDGRSSADARSGGRKRMSRRLAAGTDPVRRRWEAERAVSAAYGLPPLTRTALLIVLALVAGPATKEEICRRAGLPWRGPKNAFKCRSTSHTARLVNLGLVVHVRRAVGRGRLVRHRLPGTGGKKKGEQQVYVLTPLAMELLAKGGTRAAGQG